MKKIQQLSLIYLCTFLFTCFFYLTSISQQISYFGSEIPVNTQVTGEPVRVLLVFAEMDIQNGCSTLAQPLWQPGQLPSFVSQIINPYPSNNPSGLLSKYFYDASFGQYQVIGDYVNQLITVPCTLANATQDIDNVLGQLTALQQTASLQFGNYSGLADFDKYTLNAGEYLYKSPSPDNKIDILIVCYRNSPHQPPSSGAGCGLSGLVAGKFIDTYGINTGCSFGMGGSLDGAEFIIEELFHSMFGGNNWHLAAESGNWTVPFGVGCYGISTQISAAGQSRIVSGWDRQFCNWYGWQDVNRTVQKQEIISCLDATNGTEVSTEFLNVAWHSNTMEFIMRDFVTYGDVIKIKLPHIDYTALGDTKNQYLWIENHQLIEQFDHSVGQGSGCNTPWIPGAYAQIQIGKDVNGSGVTGLIDPHGGIFAERNFAGGWLYPLTAEGNHDYVFGSPIPGNNVTPCFNNWGAIPISPFDPNTLPNPLTGYSKLHIFYNTNNDNKLDRFTDSPGAWTAEYSQAGVLLFTEFRRGSDKTGFNSINGNKLSIATNPAPVPVFTYHTLNAGTLIPSPNQPNETYENKTTWLNGISFEIIQENVDPLLYGPGAMKVRLRFDNYDVDQDVRWCASGDFNQPHQGGIKLSPNDFDPLQPSLILKQNKIILIDRGRSETHCWATGTGQSGNYIFTLPTTFTCLPNSFATLETGSKIIVDNGSILKLQDQSKIILQAGAQIIVRNNSKLILESGSFLQLNSGAKVIVENGSTLEYNPNAEIQLNGVYSSLEIAGLLDLKDNSDFTFTYNTNLHGYVLFNSPQPLPLNIHAGINCTMNFNGSNQLRKVLEVAQEGLYPPSNLISFGIQYGRVDLHSATRILPLGWQTSVLFDHVKLTSNTIIYNGHLGLQMVGQYHSITNCIFEYGKYGIHYIATLGRNDFYASDCVFRYCDEGLYTDDKGAHLTRCNFKNNTILGWNTGVMSNPSDADEGVVGGSIPNANKQGYYYYANNSAPLTLTDPNITYNNTSGVQVERALMQAKCGTISYNINEGILLGKASTLQMDNGSNVTCVGNAFSIGLVLANYLFLYKGNNDLTPLQPLTHTAVAGTLISPGPYPILADMNKWSSGGFGPLDYSILNLGSPVTMTDWNPQTFIDPCGQAIPPPPPAGQEDPLTHCDECDLINTDDFSNEKLNDATRTALDKAQDNSAENYIEAADMFSQILMEDYINPSNKEKYLLTLNYLKMLDALGNAFGSGQLTWQQEMSVIDTITQKVIGVLNKLIDMTVNSNDYTGRLIYSLDKASVYRLADRRDLALSVLYSVSNWIGQDDAVELSRLECIYDLENQALLGSIPAEDLFYAINSCVAAQAERIGNVAALASANKKEDIVVNIYPSPALTEITLVTNVEHGEELLMNSVGQTVYSGTFSNEDLIDVSGLPKGIYSLQITDKDSRKMEIRRVVIQ